VQPACSPLLVLLFRRVVVIDDFNDPGDRKRGLATSRFPLHEKYSVEAVTRDVLQGLDCIEKFDVITSFDVLEHLHHSPKRLLHDAMRAQRPGGTLIIGVPNCMNLRKRIAWPLGVGRWTTMEEWYEQPIFRSHVREPSVADLHYIARDDGVTSFRTFRGGGLDLVQWQLPHDQRTRPASTH
jgi:SAM-dependent methyltransferase